MNGTTDNPNEPDWTPSHGMLVERISTGETVRLLKMAKLDMWVTTCVRDDIVETSGPVDMRDFRPHRTTVAVVADDDIDATIWQIRRAADVTEALTEANTKQSHQIDVLLAENESLRDAWRSPVGWMSADGLVGAFHVELGVDEPVPSGYSPLALNPLDDSRG